MKEETAEHSILTIEGRKCHEYLYIVHCVGNDYYKIGRSTMAPLARLGALQTGCPVWLTMSHVFVFENVKAVEKQLHQRLRRMGRGIRGEWFKLSSSDVEAIVSTLARHIGVDAPIVRRAA